MPIQVKDYTWEESDRMLFITVPLKGVKAHRVDIFTTETYIKVHYPPYFFDAWLYGSVHDDRSKAEVGNGAVLFKLDKVEERKWGQLLHPDASDKAKLLAARQAAIERHQQRQEEEKEKKATKKRETDSFAVNQQIELESQDKQRIEVIKTTECEQAVSELEHWKEEQRCKALKEQEELSQTLKDQSLQDHEKHNGSIITGKIQNAKPKQPQTKRKVKKPNIFEVEAGDQPLRQTGKIDVSFTHRDFPTAARESTAPQEEEWLRKQREASKIVEIADSELSEHERDPVWLRDKGNEFFKAGNYPAAINVFSHAIRLTKNMPALYSNRGACHLMIRNFIKCVEDTSKALDLLTPPVPQNAKSRMRAHIRRGTALCQLELYVEGLADYEAALKIDPDNAAVAADADRMRKIIQGPSPEPWRSKEK